MDRGLKNIIIFVSICMLFFAIFFISSTSILKENKIDKILKTESYEYLPKAAKNYIELVYEQTGEILKTEKNKESNKPYLNPEYVQYLSYMESFSSNQITDKINYDVIPEEVIVDYIYTTSISDEIIIPSSFDLRNVDGKNFVTPIKDQKSTGLCWSFATNAQAESYLLVKNNVSYEAGISQLFSEMQIDYATANNGIVDSLPMYSFSRNLGDGGNFTYATSPMIDSLGLVDVSWKNFDDYDYQAIEKSKVYNFSNSKYEVVSTVDYPKLNLSNLDLNVLENVETRNSYLNNLKRLIMENGGAYVGTVDPTSYCSISLNGYRLMYDDGKCASAGHAMQIIGWDDNLEYSFCSGQINNKNYYYLESDTSKCDSGTIITGKGAWLIKNSWGTSNPYVYLAYDSMNSTINLITGMDNKDWDNHYSYNLNYSGILTHENELAVAEKLNNIKIKSASQNNIYDIYIGYTNDNLVYYDTITMDFPGIYTVDLSKENIVISDKLIIKIVTNSGTKPQNIYVYTDNEDDLKQVITEDVYYENKLTNIDKYIFRISSKTVNIEENTKVDYKILNQNKEEILDDYTYTENIVFANQIFSKIEIANTLKHGTYILQTIINNEVMSESNIIIDKDIIVTEGSGTIDDPYIINTPSQLDLIRLDRFAYYKLGQDIDLTYDTQNENGLFYNDGKGWEPIKYSSAVKSNSHYLYFSKGFSGGLDGNNHKITGLYINRPDEDGVGLFSNVYNENYSDLYIKNIVLVDPDITGNSWVGSLLGVAYGTTYERLLNVSNIQVIGGNIKGSRYVGGVIGLVNVGSYLNIYGTTINRHKLSNLYNSATIVANDNAGGIFGMVTNINAYGAGRSPVTISNILNKGTVSSNNNASGIVGFIETRANNSITITNSINTGLVLGQSCSNDITCNFSDESYGNLYLTNIYYTGNSEMQLNNFGVIIDNVVKYEIDELKKINNYSNWSDFNLNWKIETFDEIIRMPILESIDFKYTSISDKSIRLDEKINLYDLIKPDLEAAKNITYTISDSSIITIDENDMITGLNIGEAIIHITSYYDGYEGDIRITVYEDRNEIKFNTNGGSKVDSIKSIAGETIYEPERPTKEGYKFEGWYIDETLENKYEFSVMPEENITLYAKWTRLESTIIFNTNGGSLIETITKYVGEIIEEPEKPTKEGYKFEGWYIDETLENKYEFSVMPEENITLYAKWINLNVVINNYNVSNNLISNISNNITFNNYLENFIYDDSLTVKIYNNKNEIVTDLNSKIGTASKIEFYDDSKLLAEYVNIVSSDITGDGLVNLADLSKMFNYYRGNIEMTGIYLLAGDITNDGKVNLSDLAKLFNYYRGNIKEI